MINTREIFAEEAHLDDSPLRFTLEKRKEIINAFVEEMRSVISMLKNYKVELKYMMDNKLDVSAITHLTFCIDAHLLNIFGKVYDYREAVIKYLLADNYNVNADFWVELNDVGSDVIEAINNIKDVNLYYQDFEPAYDFITHKITQSAYQEDPFSKTNLCEQINLARLTGIELMNVLYVALCHLKDMMEDIKNSSTYFDDESLGIIYDLNYELYVREYWPQHEKNFRPHIQTKLGDSFDVSQLKLQRINEISQFEGNSLGDMWRAYSNDKSRLAIEIKSKAFTDSTWKDYFKAIKRFDEYDRWIKELESQYKPRKKLRDYVVRPEIADAVVDKITGLITNETKPRSIVRPFRAAMDAGVLHRPTWDAFISEYGKGKIKTDSSFNNYTNPEAKPYTGPSYDVLVDDFKKLLE